MYGKGISREGSLIDVGVDVGIVKKSGAWFTYEGEQLGQGRENAKQFLAENPEVMMEMQERILREVGIGDRDAAEIPAAPVDDVSLNGDEAPITVD
jgi:recombination protein RecA